MIKSTPNQIPNNPQHPNQSAKPAVLPEKAFPQYEAHPAAEIFPEMDAKTLDDLAIDIKADKQHMAITLFEGKILDGRSRYLACKKAGVLPRTKEITSCKDPTLFVISRNLHRRHLSTIERAKIAERLATLKLGHVAAQKGGISNETPVSLGEAAEKMKVSRAAAARVRKVRTQADPDIVQDFESGKLSLAKAQAISDQRKAGETKVAAASTAAVRSKSSPKSVSTPSARTMADSRDSLTEPDLTQARAQRAIDALKEIPPEAPGRSAAFKKVADYLRDVYPALFENKS